MNRFNKGKLTGIIAASLSAVSLMGVGFATWVIGIQKTDTKGDISITADDVQYKSLEVSVTFANPIKLAETNETSTTGNAFTFEGTEKGNFTTSATFTFTLGKDFSSNNFDFTTLLPHTGQVFSSLPMFLPQIHCLSLPLTRPFFFISYLLNKSILLI